MTQETQVTITCTCGNTSSHHGNCPLSKYKTTYFLKMCPWCDRLPKLTQSHTPKKLFHVIHNCKAFDRPLVTIGRKTESGAQRIWNGMFK